MVDTVAAGVLFKHRAPTAAGAASHQYVCQYPACNHPGLANKRSLKRHVQGRHPQYFAAWEAAGEPKLTASEALQAAAAFTHTAPPAPATLGPEAPAPIVATVVPGPEQDVSDEVPGYSVGEAVWYHDRSSGAWLAATVLSVDNNLQPPAYQVQLLSADTRRRAVRDTEGSRLAAKRSEMPPPSTAPLGAAVDQTPDAAGTDAMSEVRRRDSCRHVQRCCRRSLWC